MATCIGIIIHIDPGCRAGGMRSMTVCLLSSAIGNYLPMPRSWRIVHIIAEKAARHIDSAINMPGFKSLDEGDRVNGLTGSVP